MNRSPRRAIAVNLAVWIGLTLIVALFGSISALRSSSLSRHFEAATATVIGLQPHNHQSFDYSYRVSSKIYTGHSTAGDADRKFETIKPGDTLTVFYDTTRPDHSTAGPPGMPGVQAISGLVGACIAIPLLIMGVLHQLRLLPPWKLFTPGPESHESLPSNHNA